jgi:prepilin-type N-terminal cleavage/methylation domain-containing protein
MTADRKGFTLVELMIVVVILGLLASVAIPNFISMVGRAREASVKKNMHVLQTSAEDFAVVSSGRYPDDASDLSDAGLRLVDHIPYSVYPENPFSGAPSAVQFDTDPTVGNEGEIAFNPATPDSYSIKANGKDGVLMNQVLSTGM